MRESTDEMAGEGIRPVTFDSSDENKGPTSLVKIAPPLSCNYYRRNRLFSLLDKSRERPVTWISAPAGSGKTTLVSSYLTDRRLPCLWYQVDLRDDDAASFFYYMGLAVKKAAPRYRKPLPPLTPEYLLGLPTFTLRYFEKLYERLAPASSVPRAGKDVRRSFCIVFDNCQDVPVSSMFHEIISGGIDIIPGGISFIIISRTDPPEAFSRMRANGRLGIIDFAELRLTEEETAGIMRQKLKDEFTENFVKNVHGRTQGWAAGLVLLLEKMRRGEFDSGFCDENVTEMVFNYFASEVFRKAEADTQDFLLRTAFFPFMDVQMADRLAAAGNANRILSDLVRNNYFIERRHLSKPVYQYHPLFREFLLSKSRDFLNNGDIRKLQQKAAMLLEEGGSVEDAVRLYRDASDYEGVIRLIMTHATAFVTGGRSRIIEEWIMSVPGELLNKEPWLLYWLGVCRLPFSSQESQGCFEKAFNGFRLKRDALGTYLSWAGIIECNFMGWGDACKLDKWIEVIGDVMREHPSFPSPEVDARVSGGMLFALFSRNPGHSAVNGWAERLNALLPEIREPYLKINLFSYLSTYYVWKGDICGLKHQIRLMNNELQLMANSTSPAYSMALIYIRHIEAVRLCLTAEPEESTKKMTEAFKIAETSGIHVWDFLLLNQASNAAFLSSDFTAVKRILERMSFFPGVVSNFTISYYDHQYAWYHFLLGNDKEARMHAEKALEHAVASGHDFADMCTHIAMANVCFKAGEHQKALQLLAYALRISHKTNSKLGELMALTSGAYFALEMGFEDRCLDSLRSAFSTGRETTLMHFLFWIPSRMSTLCAKALESGIETEYVKTLIKKRGLVPDQRLYLESWPYPVKIYTLGRFDIFRDGKPLSSIGKIQKKPLEMLRILIALGGKKVREEQLTDILWPEAEGDAAHSAFKMTLSRLRQLSGNEKIIRLHEGRITLDPLYCWVDAWAFQRIVNQAMGLVPGIWETGKRRNGNGDTRISANIQEITCLTDKAISLYKGHFLSDDREQTWNLSLREKLRCKFINLILKTGQCCEQSGHFEEAVEYYRKGLEADNLSEEICQRLMKCYGALGRKAEAVSLYDYFTTTVETILGITPSKQTEAMYMTLKGH